jgi:hypothetical protein
VQGGYDRRHKEAEDVAVAGVVADLVEDCDEKATATSEARRKKRWGSGGAPYVGMYRKMGIDVP